jgi:hypothetical protein
MQIFCRFHGVPRKASGFLLRLRSSLPFLVAFLLAELVVQGGFLAPGVAHGQSACEQLGVDCSHKDSGGLSTSGESDEERMQRRQEWAEYKAEQKAQREAQRKEEAFKQNEQGNKSYVAGDWKTAVNYYRKARKLSPNDLVIRQNLKNAEDAAKRQAAKEANQTELAQLEAKKAQMEAKKAQLNLESRQEYERDLAAALKRLKGEQGDLEGQPAVWVEQQGKIIERRLREPNKWAGALAASLTTKAPPPPYKKISELESGDVLLIAPAKTDLVGKAINAADASLSGTKVSDASHTVLYLKKVNGIRFYLDNVPGEGPRIVPEAYIFNKYGQRPMELAKLAQPLKEPEADKLYAAAREMRAKNVERIKENKWFDKTNYGVVGKDNVVCAEADWSLLRAAGREIPESNDQLKKRLGLDFSPADFHGDMRYFVVTPLSLSE